MDLKTMRQAAARAPDGSDALLRAGQQMLRVCAYADAAAALRRWVKEHPDSLVGLADICTALCAIDRKDEALTLVRGVAFDLTADMVRLRQLLALYQAARDITRWKLTITEILKRPEATIEDHYALLDYLRRTANLRDVEAEIERFAARWPRDASFWKKFATVQNELGKATGGASSERAVVSGRRALRLDPADSNFRSYYIQLLIATRRPWLALWHLSRLAAHAGDNPLAWFHVCEWALRLKRRRLFLRAADRIQALPGFVGPRPFRLGRLLWEAGLRDQARTLFRRLKPAEIQDIRALQSMFEFARVSGMDDVATGLLDQIADLFPDAPVLPKLREQLSYNDTAMTALIPAG